MNFQFYGYTVRETTEADLALAAAWTGLEPEAQDFDERALFFLKQGNGCQSFLVLLGPESMAFFQTQYVGTKRDQVRLAFQASPEASPKKILRGITKLVPLIEQALCLRGVRHIFFTSHSLAMVVFMEKLGYRLAKNTDGGADGVVMFKEMRPLSGRSCGDPCGDLGGPKVEFHAAERGSK